MRRLKRAQRFAIAFFAIQMIAVVFPGVVPFRGPEPFVLGLPFGMVWTSTWVVASFFVLLYIDSAYRAADARTDDTEP